MVDEKLIKENLEPKVVKSNKSGKTGVLHGGAVLQNGILFDGIIHHVDGVKEPIERGNYKLVTSRNSFFHTVMEKMKKEQPITFMSMTDSAYYELKSWFDFHFGINKDDEGDEPCSNLADEYANYVWDKYHPAPKVETVNKKTLDTSYLVSIKMSDKSVCKATISFVKVENGFKTVLSNFFGDEIMTYDIEMFKGFKLSEHVVFSDHCIGDMIYIIVIPRKELKN